MVFFKQNENLIFGFLRFKCIFNDLRAHDMGKVALFAGRYNDK